MNVRTLLRFWHRRGTGFGPMRSFANDGFAGHGRREQRRVRAGRGTSLRRSPLRADCPGVGLVARRPTHCAHFVRCVQTGGDKSVVDARCARGHEPWPCRPRRAGRHGRSQGTNGPPDRLCPCSPPRRLRGAPQPARTRLCSHCAVVFPTHSRDGGACSRRCPARAISVATSSAGPGSARASAHQPLTRRECLNGMSEANAVSFAARPRTEQRSAVGAKRRPPAHEPGPGCACRDTLRRRQRGHSRSTATDRKPLYIFTDRRSALRRPT
jgi:hypothetical protein